MSKRRHRRIRRFATLAATYSPGFIIPPQIRMMASTAVRIGRRDDHRNQASGHGWFRRIVPPGFPANIVTASKCRAPVSMPNTHISATALEALAPKNAWHRKVPPLLARTRARGSHRGLLHKGIPSDAPTHRRDPGPDSGLCPPLRWQLPMPKPMLRAPESRRSAESNPSDARALKAAREMMRRRVADLSSGCFARKQTWIWKMEAAPALLHALRLLAAGDR